MIKEVLNTTEAVIARKFRIEGDIVLIRNIGNGYINRTYLVETRDTEGKKHKYTLQKLNNSVFGDVDLLMDNFIKITEHLHAKILGRESGVYNDVATLIYTCDGEKYYRNFSDCWRMMTYFSHVYSMDIAESNESFYLCGRSFGQFIADMHDMPLSEIGTVIENFHDTLSRYNDLETAISEDIVERVAEVKDEIEFIRARRTSMGLIVNALANGDIPVRITHNDTNLNNILFDKNSHKPVAIIDLDTVMPSSPLYDFGDSIRIGTNTACDDERDLSKVGCDLELFKNYTKGWLESCGRLLTPKELDLLPYVPQVITLEDGIRFLADYINGDVYYKINRQKHNLDRARTQLKLVEDLERKFPDICDIVTDVRKELEI